MFSLDFIFEESWWAKPQGKRKERYAQNNDSFCHGKV